MKTTRIHVNQHNIKANRKKGLYLPVLTVKDYTQNRLGHNADIVVGGEVVASVVYRPDAPLSCGAHCWVETKYTVIVK